MGWVYETGESRIIYKHTPLYENGQPRAGERENKLPHTVPENAPAAYSPEMSGAKEKHDMIPRWPSRLFFVLLVGRTSHNLPGRLTSKILTVRSKPQ